MKPNREPFTILVLEDDPVAARILQAAFHKELPQVRVMHARTIQEAQALVAEFQANLFILDLTLPDGSGLDFMADMQTLDPHACVVLASATDSARLERMRMETGAHTVMSKPLDVRALTALVRGRLEEHDDNADSGLLPAAGFTARLKDMEALDVIQFRAVTRMSTMLEFSTPEFQAGRVYLEDGHITHVETGKITGMEALVEILTWQSGAVREVAEVRPSVRSIVGSTEVLLMHAAQQIDERRARAAG